MPMEYQLRQHHVQDMKHDGLVLQSLQPKIPLKLYTGESNHQFV